MAVALGLVLVWCPKKAKLALLPPQMAPLAVALGLVPFPHMWSPPMEHLSLLSSMLATMAMALGLAPVGYPKVTDLALMPPQVAPMATPPLLAPMAVAQGVFWPSDLGSLTPRMGMGLAWTSPRYPPMAMPWFSTVMSLALLLPRLAPLAAAREVY